MSLWKESPQRHSAKSSPGYRAESKRPEKIQRLQVDRLYFTNRASKSRTTSGTAALVSAPPGPWMT